MRYRLQRHDGTDCSATMVPIQRYRHKAKDGDKTNHELRIVEVEFKESLNR